MIYPTINEYISALEESQDNFDKLSSLRLCTDGGGHPIMNSGNFAVVFKMQDVVTKKYKAVKCFTREQIGREDSYAKIAEQLKYEYSNYIVDFEYFKKELFVYSESCKEELFPVVVMDWVNGIPLDSYIRLHANNKYALELLTYQFCLLASWLLSQPFAHGDLKPDNILVKPNGDIVLVDYDGMYVPSMKGEKRRESGTLGYVHPFHTADDFNEHIDDFALAVISLSLKAYTLDNKLFRPTETLLFEANDYESISRTIKHKKLNSFLDDTDYCSLYGLFLYVLNNQHIDSSLYSLFRIAKPEKKESSINFIGAETYEYKFVDLGLSVLWAKFNLGALNETECGDYFSWNDIHDNENFSVRNNDVCEINIVEYYHNQNIKIDHILANETRLPTIAEFNELINKCKWGKTCIQGINGYNVIGPNGNKIFLPISGDRQGGNIESVNEYGQYLSGNYHNDNVDHYLLLRYYENEYYTYQYNNGLATGRTIRPVLRLSSDTSAHSVSSLNFIEPVFVDLGLSVKWATCNLGATRPEEYGDYSAWGNNEIKTTFYESDCSTHNMNNSELLNNGIVNIDGYLTPQNDIATISLGKGWRIPTVNEFNELIKKCKWTLISNSIYKVEGPNGNHILLPLNDYIKGIERSGDTGFYWTSSIGDNEKESFGFYMYEGPHCSSGTDRSDGQAIRPVRD